MSSFNPITVTSSRDIVESDEGGWLHCEGNVTLTIPKDADLEMEIGDSFVVFNKSSDVLHITTIGS